MRKFSVTANGCEGPLYFMVEAETEAMGTELLERELGDLSQFSIWWECAKDREYRDAWRDGRVKVLKDRPLPEGIE